MSLRLSQSEIKGILSQQSAFQSPGGNRECREKKKYGLVGVVRCPQPDHHDGHDAHQVHLEPVTVFPVAHHTKQPENPANQQYSFLELHE